MMLRIVINLTVVLVSLSFPSPAQGFGDMAEDGTLQYQYVNKVLEQSTQWRTPSGKWSGLALVGQPDAPFDVYFDSAGFASCFMDYAAPPKLDPFRCGATISTGNDPTGNLGDKFDPDGITYGGHYFGAANLGLAGYDDIQHECNLAAPGCTSNDIGNAIATECWNAEENFAENGWSQFFTVQFVNQVYIKGLDIGIKRGGGSVFSIEAYDRVTATWEKIYQADEITNEQATIDRENNAYNTFKPKLLCEPSFKTDIIKVMIDTITVKDWNMFDYVKLTGSQMQSQGVKCDEVVFDEPPVMALPGKCKLSLTDPRYCTECPTENTCGATCSWTGEACEGSLCVSGACTQCGTEQSCGVHDHCEWQSDDVNSGGTCSDLLVAPYDMNFYDCVEYCNNNVEGGRIPCVGLQEEHDLLWGRGDGQTSVWIGLFQTTAGVNGVEDWIDETCDSSFTNWAGDEPNDHGGKDERCTAFNNWYDYGNDGLWIDVLCDWPLRKCICQPTSTPAVIGMESLACELGGCTDCVSADLCASKHYGCSWNGEACDGGHCLCNSGPPHFVYDRPVPAWDGRSCSDEELSWACPAIAEGTSEGAFYLRDICCDW